MASTKTAVPQRRLGKNGPLVSALGFGAMGMSEFYGAVDADSETQSLAILHAAIDAGCTFWDTADMYGSGKNEELLAKVLATRRDEVFLCTKFAIVRGEGGMGISGKPEYVKAACAASLKRLGISTIDLYYQHRPDPNTPIEDTVRAMAELVAEGKVRYLGLSECSADNIRRAHAVHPIAAYQVEYSPWCLDIETDGRLAVCRELGIAIVAYSPLGRGFLTGQYKSPADFEEGDFRRYLPRFQPGVFERNYELVRAFETIATAKGITTSQLCLAWVMAQGDDFIPIPGTKRMKYFVENWGAVGVALTAGDLQQIRDVIAKIPIEGERYTAQGMSSVNR
ncbi:auxin-induced protein PCNT115 [Entophlyctis helioformis]|nr:auxin-induced protein PCNT115 [Entophlyctis helioformis]